MDVINEAILHAANAWWILPIVYLFCLIDGFFPVLPSETLLVALGSVAVNAATPNMALLAVAGAAGAITGDQIAYRMGRRIGTERFRWMRLRRSRKAFAFAHHELMKRGAMLIFTARYIPIGRVAVNFTAGATGYPLGRFTVLDILSCLVWAAYSVGVGALAGQWFHENQVLGIVLSIVVAIVLGYLLDRIVYAILRRMGKPTEAPEYELMKAEEADGDAT
ncbi:membrane protein [Zafaria cholistanensis]|uniref:Membrane protein n=1 Tax=Zafaria cholistanensis TaxID=1682741 RepID=A0A5A7NS95_9MICC|nr:DedA family protein [Zafaria cholistanensis]GER23703.1 membrane protein [Zafaria cholistanensis]